MTTIKINRDELIKTLTAKVKELEGANKEYEKARKAHDAATEKWEQECVKSAIKNIKNGEVTVNTWYHHNTSINITVPSGTFPERPEFDSEAVHTPEYELRDIKQFIRMLEMSASDSINMSALKNMSQYL